jgi:hypothetical protein
MCNLYLVHAEEDCTLSFFVFEITSLHTRCFCQLKWPFPIRMQTCHLCKLLFVLCVAHKPWLLGPPLILGPCPWATTLKSMTLIIGEACQSRPLSIVYTSWAISEVLWVRIYYNWYSWLGFFFKALRDPDTFKVGSHVMSCRCQGAPTIQIRIFVFSQICDINFFAIFPLEISKINRIYTKKNSCILYFRKHLSKKWQSVSKKNHWFWHWYKVPEGCALHRIKGSKSAHVQMELFPAFDLTVLFNNHLNIWPWNLNNTVVK